MQFLFIIHQRREPFLLVHPPSEMTWMSKRNGSAFRVEVFCSPSHDPIALGGFDDNGSAVCENLIHTHGDLCGVIPHPNDGVCTHRTRMVDHMLERFTACLLTHLDEGVNLASDDPTYPRLNSTANTTSSNR
jgi:hypothetical protein